MTTNDLLSSARIVNAERASMPITRSRSKKIMPTLSPDELAKGRAIHIRPLLQRYFSDVTGFQRSMQDTGAIVSGSAVLQLLLDVHWPGSDFDIFLAEEHSDRLREFVVGEGYEEVTRFQRSDLFDDDTYPSVTGVTAVTTLRRDSAVVQLVEVDFSPTSSVLMFHSTAVMNFLTSDRLISLYPAATLNYVSFVLPLRSASDEPRTTIALKKYADRGFNNIRKLTDDHFDLFPLGERKIGDKHCLVLKYSDDSSPIATKPSEVDDDINSHSWLALRTGDMANHCFDFVVYLSPLPKKLHTHPPFEESTGGRFLQVVDRGHFESFEFPF